MVHAMEVTAVATTAVVVKRATGAAAALLREEGERLRAAAHPGVVQVVGSEGDDEHWELRLAHGGRPVDLIAAMPATQIAGVVAAVAATLADLHDAGIVHGRLDGSHVLIGPHGRPVLCGFGTSPVGATPADDVGALGALLAALVGPAADMEPIPDRRWRPRRGWSGWERRSLLLLADQACAEPPTRRPTARRLAAAIAEAVPGAALSTEHGPPHGAPPSEPEGTLDERRPAPRTEDGQGRSRLVALAGAALTAVLLVTVALRVGRPQPSIPAAISPSPLVEPAPSTTVSLPTTTTAVPAVPCVVPDGTAPGPGRCAQPVRVAGTSVFVGEDHFQVGQPGDLVVLGDWDCDGNATPAVLRPASGEVFVFAMWATAADVVVQPAAVVPGAVDLRVGEGARGCAGLAAQRADGSEVPVTGRVA
jgi:hypothetical protein